MTNTQIISTLIILVAIVLFIVCYRWVLRIIGVVIIPQNGIGVVTKKFVLFGQHKILADGEIVALKGEAGLQADALAPCLHFWLWPWQYSIHIEPFIEIEEGLIGIVEAAGGKPISGGRVIGNAVACDSFQSVRDFIEKGGERGPQMAVIPPGKYRINTAFFTVMRERALEIEDNMVGVVTTKEGAPLPTGEIAGGEVPGHNMFQDGQLFCQAGGYKGLQEQVLLAGRYYVNPRFATVQTYPMTEVPIANVGVVIAYVGSIGVDVTGDGFKHGNLVSPGEKGVCVTPLDPGRYPINPLTHKVECVPTANVVLNWATGKSEAHRLDQNLSTITVRSSDGFTFNLDVSQIIHIPRNDAPKVIARFGSVANLVTQVLEPTIGNYFRNAAQGSDAIAFLKERQERQDDAKRAISAALADYNVGAVDTLIGDIVPPESLMKTLTDRKIAEQEKVTYGTQIEAQTTRQQLEQAKALADTQARVVDAERKVQISDYDAQAAVKKAEGEAKSKTIQADADAMVVTTVGQATAKKTLAIGNAEAEVTKAKIESMEAGNYAAIQVAQALAGSGFKLVPEVIVGGGTNSQGGGGTLVDVLLANLIRDQAAKSQSASGTPNPVLEA
jgi:uncharacterized membrane protein YqiK